MGTDPPCPLAPSPELEKRKLLRKLELEAYASVVTAFRAQGPLTETKKAALELLCNHFSISPGRHKAEVRRAVNDDLLSTLGEGKWELQWRREGQKLVPSNAHFTSRPTTHLPQVLTNMTLATHLRKPTPISTVTGIKLQKASTRSIQTEKKVPSQRVQNVLKYIIAQRPHGSPQSAPKQTTRKAQSAPPTPLKKSLVDKKLVQVVTTSSQLAKTLSPLKALVMGKTNAPQIFSRLKDHERKKICKSTEAKNDSAIAQPMSGDKNDSLNAITSSEDLATHVPAKDYQPDSTPPKMVDIVCTIDHGASMTNTDQKQTCTLTTSQMDIKDDSNPSGPLVVKYKGLAPSTQIEHLASERLDVSTLDTQKVMGTVSVDVSTVPSTADHTLATATDHISRKVDHIPTDTESQIPLTTEPRENRKRPAVSDPPPVKKQALSSFGTNVKVTEEKPIVHAVAPSGPSVSESFSLPSLTSEKASKMPLTDTTAQESTPTVDADQLLQSLSTDSYNLEESELASKLGVDPSLLDLTGFMGIIQPEGVSVPSTPTTPLSLTLPLVPLAPVDQPKDCMASKTSHTESVESPIVAPKIKAAAIDECDKRPVTVVSKIDAVKATQSTLSEDLTDQKSEVVQLTSKDFDILREIEMNEDNILEGIPQELAATIQAIANIEEGDAVPWKN